jgi:transcription initiation factor TFIID subunit 9B
MARHRRGITPFLGAYVITICTREYGSCRVPLKPAMSRTSTESLPPAARAIALLLASTPTVQDAQPGVLHQLLEFSHRYTTQVLADALVYAEHSGRPNKVEMEDVTLAVQARVGWEFGGRVPKEVGSHFTFSLMPFHDADDGPLSPPKIAVHPFPGHADQRAAPPARARGLRPPLAACERVPDRDRL